MGIISKIYNSFGYKLEKKNHNAYNEYDEFIDIYNICKPYTMTSIERMFALYKGVEYIVKNNIPGDFVECGVWRGGSSMLIAMALNKFKVYDRNIYLFDTFEGMTDPTEKDVDTQGRSAKKMKEAVEKNTKWCYADVEDVQNNMGKTGYPVQKIKYIKGKVEDTLPLFEEKELALLRLDTDWYESTLIEMKVLYPMLVSKGVLIIDDYGHWAGAKKAIDEYIEEYNLALFLSRIDYTGRCAVKH